MNKNFQPNTVISSPIQNNNGLYDNQYDLYSFYQSYSIDDDNNKNANKSKTNTKTSCLEYVMEYFCCCFDTCCVNV
jgi:hypothetical protein